MNKYNASKGGHAPEHLRNAFLEWLDDPDADNPVVLGKPVNIDWLTGQLWNCTDVLPASFCEALDVPTGSTYAIGARKIYKER